MTIVRTLVVTVAPLLADLVRDALRPHLTLDIVAVLHTREQLLRPLRALAPDLVLLGLTGSETDACARPLLLALPSTTILVLAANGQHAWLYEMQPRRIALPDLSLPLLTSTLIAHLRVPPSKE